MGRVLVVVLMGLSLQDMDSMACETRAAKAAACSFVKPSSVLITAPSPASPSFDPETSRAGAVGVTTPTVRLA
ncbi:hypothetical protein JI739_09375 [Ramlibacter sp. AW1]|uniref:Uncharacterized protein n=1 Tax=Ramlibacter aurantiacus TaxID=2801330 RepID=A0A936ZQB7_9BURK|nr:hypothetical protein [Ramlibacter aurantiacus]MBL0420551.1 hypothetical protein [Ramlibacter aurantiacus]